MDNTGSTSATRGGWRDGLPVLVGERVRLREVEFGDIPALMAFLNSPETSRFIMPPPTTVEGFESFIRAMLDNRAAGRIVCFCAVPTGQSEPHGLVSLRAPKVPGAPWNWGFVFGSHVWGTGAFAEAARLALAFGFHEIGLPEIEAWCPLVNGRAHGAMAKLGADPELLKNIDAPDGRHGHYVRWTLQRGDAAR